MTDQMPLLEVKNLKMFFPVNKHSRNFVKAVDNVSFSIMKGKTLGLVGESGCGKTTTGKCILRIHKATDGSVVFRGKEILTMSDREFAPLRRRMGMIFQDPYGSLDPRQTAFSAVREVYVEDRENVSQKEADARVGELLVKVGLSEELGKRYPHEMSGGQRQRLGIARALATDPELIICDEPVSALDVSIQAQIINLFMKLQKEENLTYVFVAHDLAVVRHIADVVAVMYLGQIMEMMESVELYRHPMHPYTIALLSAIPIVDYYEEQKRERIVLEGEVPSPIHKPSGCPFHPRCSRATEQCRQLVPELRDVGKGHFVACHEVLRY
ncbi:MAG: ABC transporter ATP-binding protein [Lachnospiraceae bacterium]|nr:ABC transporter ATP-binding protein [Lachnospiraceae bacterium]